MCGILIQFICSGIEEVITGLTRNQFAGNRTWVRIPPAAPKTRPPAIGGGLVLISSWEIYTSAAPDPCAFLQGDPRYVPYLNPVSRLCSIGSCKLHGSYGRHLLDHLATDGAGLTGGQVAVVTVLQVDAHLLRCVFTSKILRGLSQKVLKNRQFYTI